MALVILENSINVWCSIEERIIRYNNLSFFVYIEIQETEGNLY